MPDNDIILEEKHRQILIKKTNKFLYQEEKSEGKKTIIYYIIYKKNLAHI